MAKDKVKNKLCTDLLVETLAVQATSKNDSDMIEYLKEKIKSYGLKYSQDTYGNIYVTKGNSKLYSCIVSHIDTVHKIYGTFEIFQSEDLLFAFSPTEGEQVGIGGDDKVGVTICLNALRDLSNIKVVFFKDEEVGCLGSKEADMKFFLNCNIVLQADRRGNGDFINIASGTTLCSKAFTDDIKPILDAHEYVLTTGMMTDVMTLKDKGLGVSAANISCGYYSPHSSKEIVSISDVEDCYEMMLEIIEPCEGIGYSHVQYKAKEKSIPHSTAYDYGKKYLGYDRFTDEYHSYPSYENPRKSVKMLHETNPMMEFPGESDAEDLEEYLEEIDICVSDLKSVLDDYITVREKLTEKLGKV